MLEQGEVLLTWRLERDPTAATARPGAAPVASPDASAVPTVVDTTPAAPPTPGHAPGAAGEAAAAPGVPAGPIAVQRIADHPKRLLTYEGPLRQAPGRVRRVDAGECVFHEAGPERYVVSLHGGRLSGRLLLERGPGGAWTLRAPART